ncbi:MAG: hydrolase [Oscillospiraceae bacterium]|nr:hydrolase [Oscillospiraceae bacterium]
MIFYTADLHLHHKNIICMCNRPFENLEIMHQVISENWNQVVTEHDDVYIIGDVCLKFNEETELYIKNLHGKKHLIIGNHDRGFLKRERFRNLFESIDNYLSIQDENRKVILFHYPILEWDGYFRDTYHVYGHIHNSNNFANQILTQENFENAFNAGVDVNNFMPKTLTELINRK